MSIKIDVISGFLGAGKTTLIKKLFKNGFNNEKVVLIENEFGEIGIDGSFLKESGVDIKEINSGCICCSLVGDFKKSMKEIVDQYHPNRIVIEPSGVGKLSDIINAVEKLDLDLKLNIIATVVDGGKCKLYMKNFGEFFNNQVEDADTIVVSKAEKLSDEKIKEVYLLLKEKNPDANIVLADLTQVDPAKLLEALERRNTFEQDAVDEFNHEHCCCHHHHHDDDDDEHECCHHHHDDDDDDEHECCHHHHDDDDDEHECCHHHHDDDDADEHECCHHHHDDDDADEHKCCHHHHDDDDDDDHECGCGHHHHHHHDADEVFVSIGVETADSYTKEELQAILEQLKDEAKYGTVLRAKGFVRAAGQTEWLYFDYVAGDYEIRTGTSDLIGRFVVIGSKLNKEAIEKLILKK